MENKLSVFQKNDIIFREGEEQQCMYDVCKGSVNVYSKYGTKDEVLLTTLGKGQFFGEIALAELSVRTATAVAAEDDTQLAVITGDNFSFYFKDDSDRLLAILRGVSARLRSLTAEYMEVCKTIAEAAESARRSQERNSGLKGRLNAIVRNYIKPIFATPNVSYDIAGYMAGSQEGGVRSYSRNQVIFREASASACMYTVISGRVGIYINHGSAGEKLLTELGENQFFGEMGLIDQSPRSATAIALENDTCLQVVSTESFSAYFQKSALQSFMILRQLATRLRLLTEDYLAACEELTKALALEENKNADPSSIWNSKPLQRFISEYNAATKDSDPCV